MTLTIDFPAATVEQLTREARAMGKDVETVVREAVEARLARRKRTLAEILKPIHDAVEASGMSEAAADELLAAELKALRHERRSAEAQP